jgi:ribosomal protein L9
MAKLHVLSTATGDLAQPSQDAVAAIQTLETATEGIKKRASDMRDRGAAYFENWEKQLAAMSTPEVVAIAEKRKDELAAKYAEVLTAMQETRAAFDPYWTDMTAIRKAVENGLTAETLKTFAPQVKAAQEKASLVKTRIEAVSAKLDQVGVIYTKA